MNTRSCQPNLIANPRVPRAGFTLVEIMVAVAVLSLLLAISAQVIGQAQRTWTRSTARLSQFREVRLAFDLMTRTLSQATLGSYLMDDRNSPDEVATRYVRRSELRFVCGKASDLVEGSGDKPGHAVFFQAPLGVVDQAANAGLTNLLCGRGYFVQYTSDRSFRPGFLTDMPEKSRYRLMEFSPSAEANTIYAGGGNDWFKEAGKSVPDDERDAASRGLTRPIADNIVSLIISPQYQDGGDGLPSVEIAPRYEYDSAEAENQGLRSGPGGVSNQQGTQHMLPPLVRVVMVAIDENSAERMESSGRGEFMTQSGAKFTNASQLDKDIKALQEKLNEPGMKLNYRVFSTIISLNDVD